MTARALLLVGVVAACGRDPEPASPPPPPIQPPMIYDMVYVPAGPFLGQSLRCPDPTKPHKMGATWPPPVTIDIPAFRIDRRVAGCDDYRRCLEAGACPPTKYIEEECLSELAVVPYATAARYCAWRGAKVQTYAQWQRAARGTDGREFPEGATAPTTCRRVVAGEGVFRRMDTRCLWESPAGIEYTTRSVFNNGEWTRDLDCLYEEGEERRELAVSLKEDRLSRSMPQIWAAEIRCVREE